MCRIRLPFRRVQAFFRVGLGWIRLDLVGFGRIRCDQGWTPLPLELSAPPTYPLRVHPCAFVVSSGRMLCDCRSVAFCEVMFGLIQLDLALFIFIWSDSTRRVWTPLPLGLAVTPALPNRVHLCAFVSVRGYRVPNGLCRSRAQNTHSWEKGVIPRRG